MPTQPRRRRGYLGIYLRFLGLRLQTYGEYRADALLLALSALLTDGLGLVLLWTAYRMVPVIGGWNSAEVLFIYGLMVLAHGVTRTFFDGLWTIASTVYLGRLDTFLTRPMPPLLAVLTWWTSPEGIGEILLGLGLSGAALARLDLAVGPAEAAVGAVLVVSGVAVRVGITLVLNCVGFWSNGPLHIGDVSEPVYELGRYPLGVYSPVVRVALLAVMPVAFVSVLPATYLVKGAHAGHMALLGPLVAVVVWTIGLLLFSRGVRGYTSTGG